MNDRQKLAILLLRLVGYGLSAFLILVLLTLLGRAFLGLPGTHYSTLVLGYQVVYLALSLGLVVFARTIGGFLGRDLD